MAITVHNASEYCISSHHKRHFLLQAIPRSGRRSRPVSTLTPGHLDGGGGDHSPERSGMTSEGESDVEDARTSLTHASDILDLGGVDIYADNGWDTDLEDEPGGLVLM